MGKTSEDNWRLMCFPIKFDGSAPLSHISVCFAAHQTAQYSPSIVGSRLYDAKSFQMTVVVSWRYNNRTEVTPNNWLYWLQRPVTFVFPPVHFMVLFFVLFFWCVFVFFSWRMNLWFIGLHLSSRSFAMVSEPGCDTIKMEGRKKRKKMEEEWQVNAFLSIYPLCSHHSLPSL